MRLALLMMLIASGCGRHNFEAVPTDGDNGALPSDAMVIDGLSSTTPAVIATGAVGISSLALDDTSVYWADRFGGTVKSCARNGCDQGPTTLAEDQVEPFTVTTDATRVYWTNYAIGNLLTNVVACAKTGCNGTPTELASGFFGPLGIAVDATAVYFSTYNTGAIYSCPLAGCGTSPTVLASNETGAWSVAIDATNVYWAINAGTGFIRRCAKAGCGNAPVTLTGSQVNAQSLALENGRAVWANDGDGFVNGCDLPSCAGGLFNVSYGGPSPHSINVLDGVVYWIDDDAIKSCPITGCADNPTIVRAGGGEQLVVDEHAMYWTDGVTVWGIGR